MFLLKAIHANRVRLKVLRELGARGILRATDREVRREVRRIRTKLLVLEAMRLWPSLYLRTVRHRSFGEVEAGYEPSRDDWEFLEAMRDGFEGESVRLAS